MKPPRVSLVIPITGSNTVIGDLHSITPYDCYSQAGCIDAPEWLPRGATITEYFDDPAEAGLTHSNIIRPGTNP